jgi:hypothetical protein
VIIEATGSDGRGVDGQTDGQTQSRRDQIVEECVLGGGDFGSFAEGLAETRVVITLESGQEVGTHAIAEEFRTEVGGVVAKKLAARKQELLDLLASRGEKRTDETRRRRWKGLLARVGVGGVGGLNVAGVGVVGQFGKVEAAVDSGKTTGPGASEQSHEDGFGLIVTGVCGGHGVEAMDGGSTEEKAIAGAAASGFKGEMKQSGEGGDIFGLDGGIERKPGCEFADEALVGLGVKSAEVVIEVKNTEHDAETRSEFREGTQQSYGVGAAADGDPEALAGMDESMGAQVVFEILEHRNMISDQKRC